MRTLKICLVMTFFLAALTPAISTRVAALTATLAQSKSPKEKPDKNKDAAQSKQGQPVDASQYVGGESCAECHAAEATHYALTAHNKTNVGNADVDKRSCEACHGPAKGHVDFYLNIQKLNEAGKEDEATALMNDTAKAAAAKLLSFKEMSSAESSAICLKCHEGYAGPQRRAVQLPPQRALPPRRLVQRLPFVARAEADGVSAEGYGAGHVLPVPRRPESLLRQAVPPQSSRRRNEMLRLPQPARRFYEQVAAQFGQRRYRPASNATPTNRGRSFTSTRRSKPKAARRAIRRTARPTRNC